MCVLFFQSSSIKVLKKYPFYDLIFKRAGSINKLGVNDAGDYDLLIINRRDV